MRWFISPIPDNYVLIPTVIVGIGRCSCCDKVAGFCIRLSIFNVEFGLEFDLS